MHQFISDGFTFHHNGDVSGEVEIVSSAGARFFMPFEPLAAFVAEFVRAQEITVIEDATWRELLGVAK